MFTKWSLEIPTPTPTKTECITITCLRCWSWLLEGKGEKGSVVYIVNGELLQLSIGSLDL